MQRQVLSLEQVGCHRQSNHPMSESEVQRRSEALLFSLVVPPISLEACQLDGSPWDKSVYSWLGLGPSRFEMCAMCVCSTFFGGAVPAG